MQDGTLIVPLQDRFVAFTLVSHCIGSVLAHAYAMAVSGSFQFNGIVAGKYGDCG